MPIDGEVLARDIMSFFEDPAPIVEDSRYLRDYVLTRFYMDTVVEQVANLYKSLVTSKQESVLR